jgi:hypothetical protein
VGELNLALDPVPSSEPDSVPLADPANTAPPEVSVLFL